MSKEMLKFVNVVKQALSKGEHQQEKRILKKFIMNL